MRLDEPIWLFVMLQRYRQVIIGLHSLHHFIKGVVWAFSLAVRFGLEFTTMENYFRAFEGGLLLFYCDSNFVCCLA